MNELYRRCARLACQGTGGSSQIFEFVQEPADDVSTDDGYYAHRHARTGAVSQRLRDRAN
jgi:hypothetical protein